MKKTAVVIINYNDADTTIKLLENIKDYKILNKIVVVDNASIDNSLKKLKKYSSSKIDIIKNSINKGYASGLNYGAKYLIKEIGPCNIIFSNSDIIINKEEDIKILIKNISDKYPIVGPVINEHGNINRGWKLPSVKNEILANLPLISRKLNKKILYSNDHYLKDISQVDVVSGCFFIVDSDALEKINYFDENTFLYYEENILAKKIKDINKKELIVNRVEVIHDHSVSIDKSINRVRKYKTLKESQAYYVNNYLKANILEKLLLLITNKISLFILYIRCLIKS